MRVVICDDDEGCCSQLEQWLCSYSEREKVDIHIEIYHTVEALELHLLREEWVDLIFLDIKLPEKSGIEFGRELRKYRKNDTLRIVYISGYSQYSMELFELEPLNFHQKPLVESEIIKDLNKAEKWCINGRQVIPYEEDGVQKGIMLTDILYFESAQKKVEVVTKDGNRIVLKDRNRLCTLENKLASKGFCRCHRSYLVNLAHIERYFDRKLTMENGDVLTVGSKFSAMLKTALSEYIFV